MATGRRSTTSQKPPETTGLAKRPFLDLASEAGLPDGIFSYQNSQVSYILERLGKENVGNLEYFTPLWYI
jgi:hypothetical protein